MPEIAWHTRTATIDGIRVPLREAGDGGAVLYLQPVDAPPRALDLIAARRRVVVLALPERVTALGLAEALATLGIEHCDVMGAGRLAALALRLKQAAPKQIGALVLLGPTLLAADGAATRPADQGIADEIGAAASPCLALFGTRDETVPIAAARHYRERIPDCNLVFVYDAGQAMADERPEAVASMVLDFLERQNRFLVRRNNDMIFP
jgi:pimeloyl-ACP methyl ester carboxylesterase